jgi:hypothetical protein
MQDRDLEEQALVPVIMEEMEQNIRLDQSLHKTGLD